MDGQNDLEIIGPVTTGRNSELAAYITYGHYQGRRYTVCMVTLNISHHLERLAKNFQFFFNMTLDLARHKLQAWMEIPCFVLILQSGDQGHAQVHFNAYRTEEKEPKKLGEESLSSLYLASSRSSDKVFAIRKPLKRG